MSRLGVHELADLNYYELDYRINRRKKRAKLIGSLPFYVDSMNIQFGMASLPIKLEEIQFILVNSRKEWVFP